MNLEWTALAVTSGFLLAVASAVAMIYSVVATERGAARRLQRRLAPSPDLPDLARRARLETLAKGLSPLAKLAAPNREASADALSMKLARAGHRAPYTLQIFLASKVLLAVLGPVVILWIDTRHPVKMMPVLAIVTAVFGLFLPNGWLERAIRLRQRAIEEGLPNVLDLLVTCVEAGLGLDAAVQRVAREVALAHPELSEELALTFLEVKAGARRSEALGRLAARTGVHDVKTLAATLNQTEMFGTSVATALRVQADALRNQRVQGAEERAAILSAKMTFPLVLCFLPSVLVVILGPAVVNLMETFAQMKR
jgi:tight adherence protein C